MSAIHKLSKIMTICTICLLISVQYIPTNSDLTYASPANVIEGDTEETEEVNVLAESDGIVEVNSWDGLISAMENPVVNEIQITADFSTSGLTKEYPVNGDKTIEGNGHTIDFYKHRFAIKEHEVKVKDLIIQANQINIAGNANASVFYSDTAGTLILENTSFDGIQHGQAVNMKQGHIKIFGKVTIRTKGPFEVFEAKDITFMEGAQFFGETTQTGAYRKETMNLYNNSTIIIEPNASVVLKTKGRNSVINDVNSSRVVIDIKEKAFFQVYADHIKTDYGETLINLPDATTTITVSKDATLDIQNHREGKQLGSLTGMLGTLTMHAEGSKIAYWEKGSNSDIPSGMGYTIFPRIMKGYLKFNMDMIDSAHAERASAFAESENPDRNGRLFKDVLSGKDTSNVKRLYITVPDKPKPPEMDAFTEADDTLTGVTIPGIDIEIRDESGQVWETIADEKTGEFSVQLDRAPYEAGTELVVKAIDPYGVESEEVIVPVIGITLVFRVSDTLYFRQTEIQDELMTIARQDKDWFIDVTNTRGQGSTWLVTAQAERPLETVTGHKLHEDALVFVKDGNLQSLKDSVPIHQDMVGEKRRTVIKWEENAGILLQLNPVKAEVETHTEYTTTIKWTLTDAP